MDTNYGNDNVCSVSSELTDFEKDNLFNDQRTLLFKFKGNFEITTSNRYLYFNDGADKTATLTVGNYTAATLATHIQTQLNAVSSNFTVTYSTPTYKFTIAKTASFQLSLSESTDDVWDTIGWVTSGDLTGSSSYTSEEMRIHTDEWIKFSFAGQTDVGFVGLVSDLNNAIDISEYASVTLQGNNSDIWTSGSVAYETTLTRTTNGLFKFIDTETRQYQFWRIKFVDRTNPLGPNLSFGYCYIGTFTNFSHNIDVGFSASRVDNSSVFRSDGGTLYFDSKVKNLALGNLRIAFLTADDKLSLETLFSEKGITSPFFISLDPQLAVSSGLDEFTKFVRFGSNISMNHIINSYYQCSFELVEAI
jgi:hypothetical protein